MDPKYVIWFSVISSVIGIVVRLLKSDGPIPFNLNPKLRAPLALGLGIVGGVIETVTTTGVSWAVAIPTGLLAAFTAMGSHDLFIESARGGRELGESKKAFVSRSGFPLPMSQP